MTKFSEIDLVSLDWAPARFRDVGRSWSTLLAFQRDQLPAGSIERQPLDEFTSTVWRADASARAAFENFQLAVKRSVFLQNCVVWPIVDQQPVLDEEPRQQQDQQQGQQQPAAQGQAQAAAEVPPLFFSAPMMFQPHPQDQFDALTRRLTDTSYVNLPRPLADAALAKFCELGGRTVLKKEISVMEHIERKRRHGIITASAERVCHLPEFTPLPEHKAADDRLRREQEPWRDLAYTWGVLRALMATPADQLGQLLPGLTADAAHTLESLMIEAIEFAIYDRLTTTNFLRMDLTVQATKKDLLGMSEHHVLSRPAVVDAYQTVLDMHKLQSQLAQPARKQPRAADRPHGQPSQQVRAARGARDRLGGNAFQHLPASDVPSNNGSSANSSNNNNNNNSNNNSSSSSNPNNSSAPAARRGRGRGANRG